MKKHLYEWLYGRITATDTYTVNGTSWNWATITGASGSTAVSLRCVPSHHITPDTALVLSDTLKGYAVITPPTTGDALTLKHHEPAQDITVALFARFGDTDTVSDMAQFINYSVHGSTLEKVRLRTTIGPWLVGVIKAGGLLTSENDPARVLQAGSMTIRFNNIYSG